MVVETFGQGGIFRVKGCVAVGGGCCAVTGVAGVGWGEGFVPYYCEVGPGNLWSWYYTG